MHSYDVIVIGGGAAGMMAAGRAGQLGKRVLLLEKNATLGKKLAITGGGRCNILNAEEDEHALLKHYGESGRFLYSPFSQFGMRHAYDFFESRGLPLKVEAKKRAFPVSEKASDVVKTLVRYVHERNVDVKTHASVERLIVEDGEIRGVSVGGTLYAARSYILATGGMSHPETGSTGDAFPWLAACGHSVKEPTPTIVPLTTAQTWSHILAGNTLHDVKITFFENDVRAFSQRGDVLLTHVGLSGPLILNSAGRVADLLAVGDVTASIDTYPDKDLGILEKHMLSIFDANKNKALKNVFKDISPPGTATAILALAKGIDPETKVHSVSREERRVLAELLKALPLTITGLMGFERAVVADGGVVLTEIDTKTMRSLVTKNLFVIGDVLHIRRPSGGYSLQLAWTTGYVAGSHC